MDILRNPGMAKRRYSLTVGLWAPTYLVEVFAFLLAQVPLVVREKSVLLLGSFHPKSRGANVV